MVKPFFVCLRRSRLRWLLLWVGLLGDVALGHSDILVFSPEIEAFYLVQESLKQELGDGCQVIVVPFDAASKGADMARWIELEDPHLVVLMGNHPINAYKKLWRSGALQGGARPVIGLMAVYLDKAMNGIPMSTGIHYEVQAITIFTHLRSLTTAPIRKVGVVYCERLESFIRVQQAALQREHITLVGRMVPISEKSDARALRRRLRELIRREQIDVLWLLNDSELLRAEHLRRVWQPALKRFGGVVVVGVDRLMRAPLNLGHFAVVPDHLALGGQTADLIWAAQQNNWQIPVGRYHAPIGVEKILNRRNLGGPLDLREGADWEVDYIVGENF